MKKQLQNLAIAAIMALASTTSNAQTTADLQNLSLPTGTFYNGSNGTPTVTSVNTFTSGNCVFPNKWNGSFGGYWESGWSYSNMKDSTTSGSGNQYSARTAVGYTNSTIYTVGQGGAKLKFNATAQGKQMAGFYVTNSTYAYLSMQNGDMFAKKFGGTSGNDPDWFKLKVQKYSGGSLGTDSVTFYLADFRFANNTQDYIVKTWQYVNLTSLGNADSLVFTLSSSDVGGFGMNTPNYFCLDNFTTLDALTGIKDHSLAENAVTVFPNPASNEINITSTVEFTHTELLNQLGQIVMTTNANSIAVSELPNGVYFVKAYNKTQLLSIKKVIKE
jgi:hypothetical protein